MSNELTGVICPALVISETDVKSLRVDSVATALGDPPKVDVLDSEDSESKEVWQSVSVSPSIVRDVVKPCFGAAALPQISELVGIGSDDRRATATKNEIW